MAAQAQCGGSAVSSILSDPPSRYARPDNIRRALGLRSEGVLRVLMRSPRLTHQINLRLNEMLGEVPRLSPADLRLAEGLLSVSAARFDEIARTVAVLSQAKVIQRSVCGKQLSTVVAFCGDKEILRFVRSRELPVFAGLRPHAELDAAILQSLASSAACFLFGLLPRNFQLRLVLHRPTGQLGGILDCPTPEAKEALKALLAAALAFLASRTEAGEAK